MEMTRDELRKIIDEEFNNFFAFETEDRSNVTSVSCKLFSEHIYDVLKNNAAKNN